MEWGDLRPQFHIGDDWSLIQNALLSDGCQQSVQTKRLYYVSSQTW